MLGSILTSKNTNHTEEEELAVDLEVETVDTTAAVEAMVMETVEDIGAVDTEAHAMKEGMGTVALVTQGATVLLMAIGGDLKFQGFK
ncbi:hypothetical protein F3Y22_tig00110865pilonHSYRG00183 [Hibiscus syriacus]|uniref:Uncharacterized protein n=1 Tax=Hibiscus syriacus TaxID=106335 RepID=A0A6A2ZJF8_HIBSY|nr:hypothetical protein F3Y22_tig00110865pilonHSYRG00183 [Hibiscus syriacus]